MLLSLSRRCTVGAMSAHSALVVATAASAITILSLVISVCLLRAEIERSRFELDAEISYFKVLKLNAFIVHLRKPPEAFGVIW